MLFSYEYLISIAKKVLPVVAGLVVAFSFGYYLYNYLHPPEPVTGISQHQAESVGGVKESADNADVKINTEQAKEIVHDIKYIYETQKEPVYIVQTTGDKASEVVNKEREAVGADFAIVTDKNNPDNEIDLDKLTADDKVELNQYNINCYKKVLRQIEVGRGAEGGAIIGASVSKKVSDSGQYLGIGADYDTESKKAIVKVVYTW